MTYKSKKNTLSLKKVADTTSKLWRNLAKKLFDKVNEVEAKKRDFNGLLEKYLREQWELKKSSAKNANRNP